MLHKYLDTQAFSLLHQLKVNIKLHFNHITLLLHDNIIHMHTS